MVTQIFNQAKKDAKHHWNEYTSRGIEFYYLLDPKTMYGKIAVALYPKAREVNYKFDNGDKIISTNAELFTDDDRQDFSLIEKLPQKIKDLLDIEIQYAKHDFSNKAEVNVTSVDLLSIGETEKIPANILSYDNWWWLRSPGNNSYDATDVNNFGFAYDLGLSVSSSDGAVRPAFIIPNLKSLNLPIGEEVLLGENQIKCVVISDDKVLYNDEVIKSKFDDESNNYEKSYIKNRVIDILFKDDLGKQKLYY